MKTVTENEPAAIPVNAAQMIALKGLKHLWEEITASNSKLESAANLLLSQGVSIADEGMKDALHANTKAAQMILSLLQKIDSRSHPITDNRGRFVAWSKP